VDWQTPFYYRDPDELPTPLNIPTTIRQNETPSWDDDMYEDVNGNLYPSGTWTLTYILAGPSSSPVAIVGVPSSTGSSGWTSTITPALAAQLLPGTYWWQGVLTATAGAAPLLPTAQRIVAGEGELTVQVDYGAVAGIYDGRSTAEKALAAWENCFLALAGTTGPPVKSYKIGDREMTYADLPSIKTAVDYWRARVASDKDLADGGRSRKLLVRWSHEH
jgi:hypothetical protein